MESKTWEYENVSEGSQSAYETLNAANDRLDTFCAECQNREAEYHIRIENGSQRYEARVGWDGLLSLTSIEQPFRAKPGSIIRRYSDLKLKVGGVLNHNLISRQGYTLKWSWSHHRHFEVIRSL